MLNYATALLVITQIAMAGPNDPGYIDGCTLDLTAATPELTYEQCQARITTLKGEIDGLLDDIKGAATCERTEIARYNALPNTQVPQWAYNVVGQGLWTQNDSTLQARTATANTEKNAA